MVEDLSRRDRRLPALAGVLLLLVAVEAYHLAAALALHDDVANLWAPSTRGWLLFAILAGVVFDRLLAAAIEVGLAAAVTLLIGRRVRTRSAVPVTR